MSRPPSQTTRSPGRNDPCPCGSGKKYKKCCGVSSRAQGPAATADAIPQALALFEQGQFENAIGVCEQILQAQPGHPEVLHILGLAYFQLGQPQPAEKYLKQSIGADPNNPWVQNNLARVLQVQGRHDEALAFCQQAIALQPDMDEAHNNLGNIYKGLNKLDDAIGAYRRAVALNPANPMALCNLGAALHSAGQLDEARQTIQQALDIAPDFAGGLNNLGMILRQQGALSEALLHLQKANKLAPMDPEIQCNLGGIYLQLGHQQQGQALLAEAAERDRSSAVVQTFVADQYFNSSDIELAGQFYQKALQLDPLYLPAIRGSLKWMLLQEQWDAAGHLLDQLVDQDLESAELDGFRARVYQGQYRYRQALAAAQRGIEREPDNAETYCVMAEIYRHFGHDEEAVDYYRQALQRNQTASTCLALAAIEERRHRLDQARQYGEQALALSPSAADDVHLLNARIARRSKDLEQAQRQLDAINIDPDCVSGLCCDALVEQGSILDKQGRYDEAWQAYTRAAAIRARLNDIHFDPDQTRLQFAERKKHCSAEILQGLPRLDSQKELEPSPIFIVGFPRSGTTLLEKILAAHPNIVAGDELPFLAMAAKQVSASFGTDSASALCEVGHDDAAVQQALVQARASYLEGVQQLEILDDQVTRFTDKMPMNLTMLDTITALFPQAPILHIVRNPIDACLSTLFLNLPRSHDYACDISHAAVMFRETMELAEHFRDHLPMRFLQLRYEDLVADQEQWSRKVIDFIGEQWNDACLEFYKSGQRARTASYEQVTQKIYTSSVARYRHYEKYLAEPLTILQPVMQRYGYL